MSLFSTLPEKHKIKMIYGFFMLVMFTIIFFVVMSFWSDLGKSLGYITGTILLFVISAWMLKGGNMKGNMNKNGFSVELSDGVDGVHKEDEIPDTIDYLNWKKEKNMR